MATLRSQYADHLAEAACVAAVTRYVAFARLGYERIAKIEKFIAATASALEATAAPQPWERTEAALCHLYSKWMAMEGLHLGSADEHYADPALPVEQRHWLIAFGDLWQEAEDREFNPRNQRSCERDEEPRHG